MDGVSMVAAYLFLGAIGIAAVVVLLHVGSWWIWDGVKEWRDRRRRGEETMRWVMRDTLAGDS